MHSFDYTKSSTVDTLSNYPMQSYRMLHWMEDIINNWLSDPINIKDERISSLLHLDSISDEELASLCITGTAYNPDSKFAGSTPKIVVSVGGTSYPATPLITSPSINKSASNPAIFTQSKRKQMTLKITVYTESYDGTVLLAGLLEDFLVFHERQLVIDNGSISSFLVSQTSEVQELKQGGAANAKTIYAIEIVVSLTGGLIWNVNEQSPVIREVRFNS